MKHLKIILLQKCYYSIHKFFSDDSLKQMKKTILADILSLLPAPGAYSLDTHGKREGGAK